MTLLPSIDDAIAAVRAELDRHRSGAHGGAAGFFDCAACGVLGSRLDTLVGHKEGGGRFVPVKGLRVDPATGEMSVLRIDGSVGHGAEVARRVAAALTRFGLPADAWEEPP